jgi:Domain of unknown function (DUF397)
MTIVSEWRSFSDGNIIVRDTAKIEGAVLRFTSKEWSEFLAKAKSVDIHSVAPDEENNLYAFLRWVLSKPIRTLGCALLLAVAVAAAVLAPHLLALFV